MSSSLPEEISQPKVATRNQLPTVDETRAFAPTQGGTPASTSSESDPFIGTRIGRYHLLQKLGEGGMGSVYLAEQSEPVKRQVALKLIRGGVDSRTVIARFEAERQALAVMDHPNIARIYDGGTTISHQPYFVMELVQGEPITEYCDKRRLSPKHRMDLFIPICQAVQHAHQKGIIHRDLKPSNVLVTEVDGKPVPKVIDFGVAKATEQQLTDQSLGETGAIVGTPIYMSPEQAAPDSMDIDTRTDIYALGVMLYELLTGTTPIDARQFRRGALLEMLRMVLEKEPPKPSTKLSSAEALPSIAANRSMEPKQLQAMLRNDIDWIVMKAIEKDRSRRYETANGFAADVQRYLSGEAVLAHPPSGWYRTKKFVKRNRLQVIAAGLVVAALIAGVIGTTVGLHEAQQQTDLARKEAKAKETARAEEARQRALAEAAEASALKRLANVEKANAIMASIFENLDPREVAMKKRPLEAILVEKVDKAIELLDQESIGDELVVAEMQHKLGLSLTALGKPEKAIVVFDRCRKIREARLGPDHPDTIKSIANLATVYQYAGRLAEALPLHEKMLKLREAKLGPDHPHTLMSMSNLASGYLSAGRQAEALPLFEESFKRMKAKLGPDHPDTLVSMSNLASGYKSVGRVDEALQLNEETLKLTRAKLGPNHPYTITYMNNLATGYESAGRVAEALSLYQETLKQMKARLGPDHPNTLMSMSNLAFGYQSAGRLAEALPLFEETLKLRKAKLGPDHPSTLMSMNNLANGYESTGRLALALPLYEETLKLRKAKLEPDHPDTLMSMNNLANGYHSAGRLAEALPLFEETLKLRKVKLGPDHPDTLTSMHNLALGYKTAERLTEALPLYEETLKLRKAKLGSDHPHTLLTMNNLANAYRTAGRLAEALPLYEETLKLRKTKLGPDHPDTLTSMNNLALGYQSVGQLAEALPLFEAAVSGMEKREYRHERARYIIESTISGYDAARQHDKADDWRRKWLAFLKSDGQGKTPPYAGDLASWGLSLLERKKFADAEPLLRECLAIRAKKEPDAWSTFYTQSLLGGALLGQKKYAEAEPLLIKGYEGMKVREKTPGANATRLAFNQRLPDALDRLIQFYTETNKPDEVKKWQAEKEKLPKPVVPLVDEHALCSRNLFFFWNPVPQAGRSIETHESLMLQEVRTTYRPVSYH